MVTSLLTIFDSIENFFSTIADALQFNVLMWVFLGVFVFLIIITMIRLRFTYEVRAIKSFKKINKYLLKKPQINESNLAEFNKLMKNMPYQLRARWQYYMLNSEGLPSSEMTLYHCVEQPLKTSSFKSTIVMLTYITNIVTALSLLLSFFASGGSSVLTSLTFVRGLIIPALFYILCQLYIYILNAEFNAKSVDLYEYYLSFIRNLDKASVSIPSYVDYELLFTEKEIREGIPVLGEYLEKQELLEKLAGEKAKQNERERENFDFTSLGIDGSLLVERAMTTSQDFLNNERRLKEEITKLETQKDNYNEQYVSVEKDNQKKLQAIKENLQRLQSQLESSASKIEANYIKKQIDQEKSKQTEINKNLEDMAVKYAQQVQFLEDEIAKRQAEIEEYKKSVIEQMDAEFRTYDEKVYTILRNKLDQDDADALKVTRAELDEIRDKLSVETQEKENLALSLDMSKQQVDTLQSSVDALNNKIAKLTTKDRRNIAKMYDENIELKKRVEELEAQLNPQQNQDSQDEQVVYYDKDGNVVDFNQYYDEDGRFKEFPKVYDSEGNYYDFADYYDRDGNLLNAEESTESAESNVAENLEQSSGEIGDTDSAQPESESAEVGTQQADSKGAQSDDNAENQEQLSQAELIAANDAEIVSPVEPEKSELKSEEEAQSKTDLNDAKVSDIGQEELETKAEKEIDQTEEPAQTEAVVEAPKKKRGRPKKVQNEDAGQPQEAKAKRPASKKPSASKSTKTRGKSTTKSKSKNSTRSATKKAKRIEEDLDVLSGQIDTEQAKLEQKQTDLKNKITQTLSELQGTPIVDRDLEDIKKIIKDLKKQAAEVNKNNNDLSEEEKKQINKQINKSLSELLLIMANKSKK